jgi:hypothetical protein
MAFTYQTVVDLARIPLNDGDKVRITDDDLLTFANAGMLQLLQRRPDYFIGQFSNLPTGENSLTDIFPLDASYVQTVADYVTFRAETIDDEKMNEPRAMAFAQLFGSVAPA